jgi:hypothetical protein
MDVESLAKQLILKGMTEEQQMAVLESIKSTMLQARTVQKQRVGENVQVVVQALKKLEADIKARYDETGKAIEKRVASIKDGKDGQNGVNGKDGRDGRPGRDGSTGPKGNDGLPGRNGIDGVDGVSVTNAFIDFDGSLIINLSNGQDLNVGEVVAPDLAEKIKVITNGGGTSQQVLDTLASLQTQINNLIPSQTGNAGKVLTTDGTDLLWDFVAGGLDYQGTWNASTNTPTLASGVGVNGYYYITATAGSTNLDGITDWEIGDWLIFNGTVWQKIDQSNLVTSVNGQTGAVSLTTTNINEGTNLYYTDARARAAISAGTGISYDSATGVVTNASPDQTVSLTGAGTTSISGTYPNFTITSADSTVGTVTSVSGTGTVSGISLSGTVTSSGNLTLGGTLDLSSPPTIGNTTPNTGRFTTLTVDDNTTLGTSNTDTVMFTARINSDFEPATDNTYDLGRTGHEWRDLFIDGTANIDSLIADTADINAGTIDNTSIGASTASTGAFTTLSATGTTTLSGNQIISVTDSTNAALRITQLGTGNALLVEDSTNPDATPFVINSSGVVITGTTSQTTAVNSANGTAAIPIIQANGLAAGSTSLGAIAWFATGVQAPSVVLAKSNSGTVGTHTVVTSGTLLGQVSFQGSDGTAFVRGATIEAAVDGTPGTNDMPGRLVFSTTADGAATPTERVRIDSEGKIAVGTTPVAGRPVIFAAPVTGAANGTALQVSSQVQSDVTGQNYQIRAILSSAGGTQASMHGFNVAQTTFTGVVTNQYGFHAESSLTGATNNYGFYGNIASGTGRYNFYAAGTADNYFAGNVGIGTSSPVANLQVGNGIGAGFVVGTPAPYIWVSSGASTSSGIEGSPQELLRLSWEEGVQNLAEGEGSAINFSARLVDDTAGVFRTVAQVATKKETGTDDAISALTFSTSSDGSTANLTERARIDSAGSFYVATDTYTGASSSGAGGGFTEAGLCWASVSAATVAIFNRQGDDGQVVAIRQAGTTEGNISVSGTTVSYNGGHLSRWAQTLTPKDESLVKGTVLSNLDEMNVYTDAEGNPVENEQLNKVKVSDVEGDANVAGVFVNWEHDEQHNVDEINMAMTGDMIIRIAQGVTVARGDLLMSAGDGTAKPQGDDIVRSKTIAKVTSTHVTCTYADGSFCVPCVLMAC